MVKEAVRFGGSTHGTLTRDVMENMRRRIASRALLPGARLPSIRQTAAALKVSKATVVEAYDRLVANGEIVARKGSGFYVSARAAPLQLSPRQSAKREIDPFWVSRLSLEPASGTLMPGCGWLPKDWMPQKALTRALRKMAREEGDALVEYGSPMGEAALRQRLAARFADNGVTAAPDQILLTGSGTQAIDLVCRLLIEPGDCVLLDDPCYFNFQTLLKAHRVRIVRAPYLDDGPDMDIFEATLRREKPRLYITNSALHNPTGAALSPVKAHRVLKAAEEAGMVIVEDDIFADFETAPAPRLAAFDGFESVVQIGSFSKTLSAGIRCGYIAARADWIERLVDLKIATSFGSDAFSQKLVLSLLEDGSYRKHLDHVRLRLAQKMRETELKLRPIGITPAYSPNGGMFLWCRLPEGFDAGEIARQAMTHDIVLAPGQVFSCADDAGRYMRFNVSRCDDERIHAFLANTLR
ncbi:aminotransferase-like domain-containing protein [Nitratireductor sp. CH_MIT9313-5]|uniref:aminotransferase-like domain-containing protein n=1 Tax=Nitratireductor sp. CH_MIT9313-5 TaxID=3107764 RepID=UPI003008D45C